jgi:hypothetical protein
MRGVTFSMVVSNRERRGSAFVRPGSAVLFGVLPAVLLLRFIVVNAALPPHIAGHPAAVDFHTFWRAAGVYLHQGDPYPNRSALTSWDLSVQQSFVYPEPLLVLLAPFAVLPYTAALPIFVPLLAIAAGGALWWFGVRDWRCYGAAFASLPLLDSISLGTITPLLLLGLAILWRWRNRTAVAALAAAFLLVAKLFLWPAVIWLWFTGRRRAACMALVAAIAMTAAAWSWTGFASLPNYVDMLKRLSLTEGPQGYSPVWWVAHSSSLFLGLAIAGAGGVAWAARRKTEASSFSLMVVASLLLTPILWLHYLALLPAIIAVHRPRLSLGWLLPLVLWFTPQQGSYGAPWRTLLTIAVLVAVVTTAKLEAKGHGTRHRGLLTSPSTTHASS